jgi:hypothetical protein
MLADDPWWSESGDDVGAAREAAVDELINTGAPETAALVALLDDRPDEARAAAARIDGASRHVTELAIDAWHGDADARAQLEAVAKDNPASSAAVVWLARLAAKDGDGDGVSRYRRWAATSAIAGSDIGEDVVVTDDPTPGAQVPGSNGNLQGWYVYQR